MKLSSHSDLRAFAKCVATDRDRIIATYRLTSSGPVPERKREVEHFHKEEIGGSPVSIDRKPAGIIGQFCADRGSRFCSSPSFLSSILLTGPLPTKSV